MAKSDLTADRLRELLHYDPETGLFTCQVRTGSRSKVGEVTGCSDGNGYLQIRILGRSYRAHRLAWIYVHGCWPARDIDHINGVRDDNRIANLRDVTRSINMQNIRTATAGNKSSGLLGVSVAKLRWKAMIRVNGRNEHIGVFDTPELAHEAYLSAKRKHHLGNTI